MSAAIDTEGGIIIISESVFKSPTQKIEPKFLPFGDKAVKLACCYLSIIALGQSGRVYESDIINKFEEVKEFAGKKVVDISGTNGHYLAVLSDGKVFGRGYNWCCKLGFSPDVNLVSSFTEIKSLSKYKIVSAFAGTSHSIFKSSNGKMIVCGYNEDGQLFSTDKETIFPPAEVEFCQGFSFCAANDASSVVFVGIDAPKNIPNKKIESFDIKKDTSKTKKLSEVEELKQKLALKEKEIIELKKENSELKSAVNKNNERIEKLEKENSLLKRNQNPQSNHKDIQNKNILPLPILGSDDINKLTKVKKIGRGTTSEVFEVKQEVTRALKVLDTEICKVEKKDVDDEDEDDEPNIEFDIERLKRMMRECEALNNLDHPNIIKTFGFFFGDSTHEPAILLEHCESNLKK